MIQMIFILVLLIPILAIVLDSPVGRALAGRMERRGLSSTGEDVTSERLSYLEGEVKPYLTGIGLLKVAEYLEPYNISLKHTQITQLYY